MAATVVRGNVYSLNGTYSDGAPRVEVRVQKSRAAGLPYREGEHVRVRLKLAGRWYTAALHESPGTPFVYFSPTLTASGEQFRLGRVLADLGVGLNERLQLHVAGTRIQVRDKWDCGLHTSASRVNRQIGSVPRTLAEIRDASVLKNPTRFYPHMRSLRAKGHLRRLDDGRYVEAEAGVPQPREGVPAKATGGAGFGDPETNRLVEEAAREAVREMYEAGGWEVTSVEHLKCGHDLVCRKGDLEEHVEVKGASGPEQRFPITAGEVRAAKKDPKWHLCVVTSALSEGSRKVTKYDRDEFLVRFDLKPLKFMATLSR